MDIIITRNNYRQATSILKEGRCVAQLIIHNNNNNNFLFHIHIVFGLKGEKRREILERK